MLESSACFLYVHVEDLPSEEIKNVLEKVLSEWKSVSQRLEDLAREIQLQEDINNYFKQLDELDKIVRTKEEWVRQAPVAEASQKSLASVKDACQVQQPITRLSKHAMPPSDFKTL